MIPVNRPPIPVTLGTADNLEHEANRPANSHEKLGPCVSPNFGPKAGYNMQKLLRKPSTCFSHIPDDGDKPEDGGSGEAMIEHLEIDAVHCGKLLGCERCVTTREFDDGKDGQHAEAKMIDGRVGEDTFQVLLGERRKGRKNHGSDRKPQERSQDLLHLRTEQR